MTDPSLIRNFSIIAHIDHGKSTLSDRILELTGTVASRDMQEQLLDSMDIERERGITIKSQAVRVDYTADDGQTYQFNLIDTPGHVDFTYEVSRSLAACEGAVLVVDATQGVEAQTVANAMMAMNANLEIIPLINKIDLPAAEPDRVREEIEEGLAIPADDAVLASGKTGAGVHDLLEAVVYNIPAPEGDATAPLRALIFDSYFDPYRGVVALVRVVDGAMKKGDKVLMMATGTEVLVEEVGARHPAETPLPSLSVGEVGYLVTGLKDVRQVKVGDTITAVRGGVDEPLPGYREAKPMVFTGLFPIDGDQYEPLKEALEKLSLNDPALAWEPEKSHALGFGFRVGFLGLLHMEVIKERLEREFGLDLLATAPSVEYHVYRQGGEVASLHSPQEMPDPGEIERIEEPYLKAKILIPPDYVGAVMDAHHRAARHVRHHELPVAHDGGDDLGHPTLGAHHGLLRQAEVQHEGLREPGLRVRRVQAFPAGEAGHPSVGQAHRRAVVHRAQGQGVRPRAHPHGEAEGDHPAPDVRGAHPGRHRRARAGARDGEGEAQGRAGQVLRRRHQPQAQAAGKTEGRQEAHEVHRQRGSAARGVHGDPEGGRLRQAATTVLKTALQA